MQEEKKNYFIEIHLFSKVVPKTKSYFLKIHNTRKKHNFLFLKIIYLLQYAL